MNLTQIELKIKENQYIIETIEQLEKDFLLSGINLIISKPIKSYDFLFHVLLDQLYILNKKKITELLYRVDLSEEFIRSQITKSSAGFLELISELIIKRVLYKVILKKQIETKNLNY